MTDPSGAPTPPGGAGGGGQDPQPTPTPDPTPPPGGDPTLPADPGTDPQPSDELARVRREAAAYRTRLRDAEQERDRLKQAQETDQERREREAKEAGDRATAAETRLRAAELRYAVATQAGALGVVDLDAAVRLLPDDAIEYDDQGQPKNVREALEQLVKDRPWLTASGGTGGGARGGSAANAARNRGQDLSKVTDPHELLRAGYSENERAGAA